MKKIKPVTILLTSLIFLFPALVLAAGQYREINTSQGKVIVGMDKEKAYQTFGAPTLKEASLWYYAGDTDKFFVSFSDNPNISLYPDFYQSVVGVPLEFKVFLDLPELGIRDITKDVQLIFDRPEAVKLTGAGVIIPKRAGEYSVLATYKGFYSNPLYMQIKESQGSQQQEKEQLLSIDILPYRSIVTPDSAIDFVALGTFFDSNLNKYSVRDLTGDAAWFMRLPPNRNWGKSQQRRLYFLEKGQAEILAKYKTTESFLQRVETRDKTDFFGKRLKHLLILPEAMTVLLDSEINIRVFGTYYDNSVMELTPEVKWKISNPDILESSKNGYFFTKAEGVTEVTAVKDGLEGLPVKVAVVNKSAHFLDAVPLTASEQEDTSSRDTLNQIKEKLEKIKNDFLIKKKELRNIVILPKSLELGLGEEGRLAATGIYNDGSSSDLTVLGSWGILDKSIATISGGKVNSTSVGETNVYVEFKGVRSEYVRVVVGGPRLVSLLLTPQSLNLPRDGKAALKVQGNYYDHSQRDLTGQVSWGVEGAAVVQIENGVLRALKFGQTKVFAEYFRIKSNTASIHVILTLGWLLKLLAKIMLAIFLGVLTACGVLYLLAENKRRKLRSLRNNPREFLLGLHENAVELISIFGLRYNAFTFPLLYAELVKQKFMIKNDVFLNFSTKFEEAKYSRHNLEDIDVVSAVNDYNNFFEKLCQDQSRLLSFYRYCLALAHCRPITIISARELQR
ncbi:MAG TPA: hypothetical protein PL125_03015 [Candidatus Omnitrophota bacterium]|nr:hypothetical protein [Candidatus Omnitrophota bacterium]